MPTPNNFRHQQYTADRPLAPYHVLRADGECPPASEGFSTALRQAGAGLRRARVGHVILAHGTFAGPDALGILMTLGTVLGRLNNRVRAMAKRVVDAIARDTGNFTRQYEQLLQRGLNQGIGSGAEEHIPVTRFLWSSENNHIGRADGAIHLLELIAKLGVQAEGKKRLLLVGHSHGGNVFALASNLLGGEMASVGKFFDSAAAYYRIPKTKIIDARHWGRARRLLMDDADEFRAARDRLRSLPIDFVTLGTPIRYGWDLNDNRRALHFVNHKPDPGLPEYLARFPQNVGELSTMSSGDIIHLLGIAGTNILPNLMSPRAIVADKRLHSFLQPGIPRRDVMTRIRMGMRVAQQGETLLVDYGEQRGNVVTNLAGHAVYTKIPRMAFHLRNIAKQFYE